MTDCGLHSRRLLLLPTLALICCCMVSFGQSTVYEYQVPAGGYDGVGNLTSSLDSVNGSWSMHYDALNRFTSGSSSSGPFQGYSMSEGYDSFGNRLSQAVTYNGSPTQQTITADYDGTNGSTCPHPGSNRLCFTSLNGLLPSDPTQGMDNGHDAAGNLLSDGVNYYKYDAEGRLCASYSTVGSGYTQYFYDADGNRIAKGSSSTLSCPGSVAPAAGSTTAKYLLGPSGEQVTELDGNNGWVHTNVFTGGALLASYSSAGLHFPLSDPIGTVRMEVLNTNLAAGQVDQQCSNLAFGDDLVCNGPDATEHHFTGKERDAESGLDYFGARYYGSNLARFTSPDDGSDQSPSDPQSWNLYSYVRNNPVTQTDSDGRSVNVCTTDEVGSLRCSLVSNDQYTAAQQGNGSLNVPTLAQVGANGNGSGQFNPTSITDGAGKSVGSATYVSDGGADYYANANGYSQLANTSRVVKAGTVAYAAIYGSAFLRAGGLSLGSSTTLGTLELDVLTNAQAGAIIGWGTGQSQAGVLMTEQVTASLTQSDVAAMEAKGLNLVTAQKLLNVYERATTAGKAAGQAIARKELMLKIIEFMKK